jgi:hypothetical protein
VGAGAEAAAEVGTFGSASVEIEAASTLAAEPNETNERIARDKVMRGIRARPKKNGGPEGPHRSTRGTTSVFCLREMK